MKSWSSSYRFQQQHVEKMKRQIVAQARRPKPNLVIETIGSEPRLVLYHSPYELKDTLKRFVTCGMWDRDRKAWHYPATGARANTLTQIVKGMTLSPEVRELLDEHERETERLLTRSRQRNLPPVPGAAIEPWAHQREAYWFLRERDGGMLAMEMATGKSAVICWMAARPEIQTILITCPKAVVPVWPEQFALHCDRQVRVVALDSGSTAERATRAARALALSRLEGVPVALVINHEAVWRGDLGKLIAGQVWDLAVVDESHRMKTAGGKFSMFMARIRDNCSRRVLLTGTPMPNGPRDIYAQFRFMDPEVFGRRAQDFDARYLIKGGYEGRAVVGFQNMEELTSLYHSRAYRVRTNDVLDLPPVRHQRRYFELEGDEKRNYKEMEKAFRTVLASGEEISATNALTHLLRLSQITGGAMTVDQPVEGGRVMKATVRLGNSKAKVFADALEDIDREEPIVVFCRFIADMAQVSEVCKKQGRAVFQLGDGKNELAQWKEYERGVLVVQIQAGGTGIDLSLAHYCFYYSVSFNLGDYLQSLARLNRPGQKTSVTYIHLLAKNTIDEIVYEALQSKEDLAAAVVEALR